MSTAYSQVGAQQQYQMNNVQYQMDSMFAWPNRLPAERTQYMQSTEVQREQRPYLCSDNNRFPFPGPYEPDRALHQFNDGRYDLSTLQYDAGSVDQSEFASREPHQDRLRSRGGHRRRGC